MCWTGPFEFRWLKKYIHNPSYYHHQIGSIHLSHCCHIFPWLCVWDGCTIIFCHLLHIYPGNTGTLFPLLMFSLWYLQMIGYIVACRSCSFVCRLHHLIIIIMQTYLKALNYQNACQVYDAECVSKIKTILSIIFVFTIWGCVSSAYPILLWWSRECVLYFIIIIKPEVWIINHCLGLGHETMVCAVCLTMFLWAAYHVSTMPPTDGFQSVKAMLAFFQHEASPPAMVFHSFEDIQAAVQHINPGQTPVISVEQPLFAQGKQLQLSLASAHVVTACSLHIAWVTQLPQSQLPRRYRHYLRHLVCPGESWESSITVLVYMSWTGNIGVYFCSVHVYRGLWLVCWVTDKANTLVLQSQPHKLCKVKGLSMWETVQPRCNPPTSWPWIEKW